MDSARAWRARPLGQHLVDAGARFNIPAFSAFLYRYRNLVERFFKKLKHYRAIATRFVENTSINHLKPSPRWAAAKI